MNTFTDGTMTGNTLSMVDMEKRLEALTTRLDALTKAKKISVATPNNYAGCTAYQIGNVVTAFVNVTNIPTGNTKLITGLPKPTMGIIEHHPLMENKQGEILRTNLDVDGTLYVWFTSLSGKLVPGNECEFSLCYITEEV